MSISIVIIGPNLRDQSKGSFHVHVAGCADIKRSYAGLEAYEMEASSVEHIVTDVYSNQIEESGGTWRDYWSDFHFAPCVTSILEVTVPSEVKPGYGTALLTVSLAREMNAAAEEAVESAETVTSVLEVLLADAFDAIDALLAALGEHYGFDHTSQPFGEPGQIVSRLKAARDWHADQYEEYDTLHPDEAYHAGKAAAYADACDLLYGEGITLYAETEHPRPELA